MLLVTAPQGRRRPVFREFSGRRPWFWPCGSCPRVVWDSFVAPLLVQLVVAAVFRSCRRFPLAFSSVPLSWAWMVRCVVARIKCRVLASSGSWTQHRVGGDTVPASKSFRARGVSGVPPPGFAIRNSVALGGSDIVLAEIVIPPNPASVLDDRVRNVVRGWRVFVVRFLPVSPCFEERGGGCCCGFCLLRLVGNRFCLQLGHRFQVSKVVHSDPPWIPDAS